MKMKKVRKLTDLGYMLDALKRSGLGTNKIEKRLEKVILKLLK